MRARSLAIVGTFALALVPAPGGLAQEAGPPTGSTVSIDLPAGDLHRDEGLDPRPVLEPTLDVLGLDAAWDDAGLRLDLEVVGPLALDEPEANISLALVDLSEGGGGAVSASWDGVAGSGWGVDGPLEDCGGSVAPDGDQHLVVTVPTACMGDVTTWWVTVATFVRGQVNFGDTLLIGDEGVHAGVLAVVHAPGTEPEDQALDPQDLSVFGTVVEDEDPDDARIQWSDPAQDDGGFGGEPEAGSGAADLVEVTVVDDPEQGITVTGTFVDTPPESGSVQVQLFGTANEALIVGWFGTGTAATGAGATFADLADFANLAMASRPDDWGVRSCRVDATADGADLRLRIPSTCPVGGTFEQGFTIASASGRELSLDIVVGRTQWSRTAPPLLHTPVARDVSATCEAAAEGTDFSDIDGNVHADAIRCVAGHGIAQGRADGTYGPKVVLSRGQIATFLLRTLQAAGTPLPAGDGTCSGGAHGDNLDVLVAAGIMVAQECDVASTVTRSQMAQITTRALRHAGWRVAAPTHWFVDDFSPRPQVELAHDTVAELGIVTGTATAGHFAPDLVLRRDQMATFLARLLDVLIG